MKELRVSSACPFSQALRAVASLSGAEKKQVVTITEGEECLVDNNSPASFISAGAEIAKLTGVNKVLFPEGNGELARWIEVCEKSKFMLPAEEIKTLSDHLLFRTFVAEKGHVTGADIALYVAVHKWMDDAAPEALQQLVPLVRWFDHMQHLDGLRGVLPHVDVIKKVETKKPKGADKHADKGKKKSSNELGSTPNKKTDVEPSRPLDDPTRMELRVGVIVDVWHHPDADSLYCEKIDIGEAEPRQIASGLRNYISLENMKNARVLVFANLKQKALRGFPSHGMVLCAKSADGSVVEFVTPPASAKPGDLVTFEGLEGQHEQVLTCKKNADALAAILPGLRSDDHGVAMYKQARMLINGEPCVCKTVTNGTLS